MQTNSLPIQLNTTAPAQRSGAFAGDSAQGGASFGAMLSNEMELRQPAPPPAPAPAPAPKTATPKPQAADRPAQPDGGAEAPTSQEAAKPADADKTAEARDSDDTDSEDGEDDAQPGQAGDPASAMLALMASLQPARDAKAAAATNAAAQAQDVLGGATGKGKRGDTAQLTALQAAMKSMSKDAAHGGDDRSAAVDAGGKPGVDLRAALAATAGKGQAEPQLDARELSLLQARETAAAREPAAAVAALAQAQPAAMAAVQAAAGAAEGLSARVGTQAWENQVGQKVVYMVGSEEQTASLTLNPPDLGPLQVVLSVSNDQASVTFSANQEEVRQALENALPRLREMMSESGIALGNATVNAGMPDNGQAQQQAARNSGGFGGNGRGGGDTDGKAEDSGVRPVTRHAVLGDRGMVDTFA
ncbi:flagellar hook-length control protein FliK [Massilia norwichensis]|uniref:Flagellar hook-length control protein FliK n=1 Tax=Massilia norwichensis TaxID=1442366 RepID=A0ABT2A5P1_9BURK|nr:flagellar hook-length control protein FliK [Massilia norwichensis]MCS0589464.1 flagellar hook-length control protein FliK [Massilia norwichensis]